MSAAPPVLVTVAEAVIITRRKKSAIYAWIKAGKITATRGEDGILRIDGRILLDVEAIAPGRPARAERCPTCGHEAGGER